MKLDRGLRSLFVMGLGALAVHGCSSSADNPGFPDGAPHKVALKGAVQKGPFVLGSSVSISVLDKSGSPTGSVFNTQTTTDLGEFALDFTAGGAQGHADELVIEKLAHVPFGLFLPVLITALDAADLLPPLGLA